MTLDPTSWAAAALLLVVGVAAGFVNTLAGGGSLLTLPALMLVGLPVEVANGTNRLSVFVQSLSATAAFRHEGLLDEGKLPRITLPMLIGSFTGAWIASVLPPKVLEPMLVAGLLLIATLLVYKPKMLSPPDAEADTGAVTGRWAWIGLLAIGAYGGFLQAGVGIFLLAFLGGVMRLDLVRGNALKVATVAALTAVALGVFLWHGLVRWVPGLALTLGTVAGAQLAVRFAVKRGGRGVRVVFFFAVVACVVAAALR